MQLMPCTSPIDVKTPDGHKITVRCKQCLNCRILKNSALRLRALLEHQHAVSAQFVTLTYRTEELPETPTCRDIQNFLKRLRFWNKKAGNSVPIRYLYVGEYGTKSGRFHWHILIFNSLDWDTENLHIRQWPHGHVHIGTVTPSSISYTVQYTMKFDLKGEAKPLSNWSQQPPLGAPGIIYICEYLMKSGCPIPELFNTLQIEGKKYWLDTAMRDLAGKYFASQGLLLPTKSATYLSVLREQKILMGLDDDLSHITTSKMRDWDLRFLNEQI